MPDLRPLPVDLDDLAGILDGDPMYGGGRVDLATGEVWPAPAVDYAREIGQEDEDESDAISGRGAFRRFKDVLALWPGELDQWYAFSAERQRGRARAWLADAGYFVRKGLPPS